MPSGEKSVSKSTYYMVPFIQHSQTGRTTGIEDRSVVAMGQIQGGDAKTRRFICDDGMDCFLSFAMPEHRVNTTRYLALLFL